MDASKKLWTFNINDANSRISKPNKTRRLYWPSSLCSHLEQDVEASEK